MAAIILAVCCIGIPLVFLGVASIVGMMSDTKKEAVLNRGAALSSRIRNLFPRG